MAGLMDPAVFAAKRPAGGAAPARRGGREPPPWEGEAVGRVGRRRGPKTRSCPSATASTPWAAATSASAPAPPRSPSQPRAPRRRLEEASECRAPARVRRRRNSLALPGLSTPRPPDLPRLRDLQPRVGARRLARAARRRRPPRDRGPRRQVGARPRGSSCSARSSWTSTSASASRTAEPRPSPPRTTR